jgi:hypothetical protein
MLQSDGMDQRLPLTLLTDAHIASSLIAASCGLPIPIGTHSLHKHCSQGHTSEKGNDDLLHCREMRRCSRIGTLVELNNMSKRITPPLLLSIVCANMHYKSRKRLVQT